MLFKFRMHLLASEGTKCENVLRMNPSGLWSSFLSSSTPYDHIMYIPRL